MALTDYSDLEKEIEDAPEPKILPRGAEVKARIIAVNEGISIKNDAQWYMPVFDVPSDPLVIEFNDFFWDLNEREQIGEKQYQRLLNRFGSFVKAFGIDLSKPFDWIDSLINLEGWVILGIQKDDDYGDKNKINKYVIGR